MLDLLLFAIQLIVMCFLWDDSNSYCGIWVASMRMVAVITSNYGITNIDASLLFLSSDIHLIVKWQHSLLSWMISQAKGSFQKTLSVIVLLFQSPTKEKMLNKNVEVYLHLYLNDWFVATFDIRFVVRIICDTTAIGTMTCF